MAALSSTSMAEVLFLVLAPTSPSTRATAPRVGPPSYSISAKRVICDNLSKTKNNLSKTKKNPSNSTRMTSDLKNDEVKQEHLKKVSICSVCKSENIRWSRYKNNYFGIFLVPHISRPLFLYLILWKIIEFSQNKHLQRVGEQEIKTISSNSIEARKIEDFLLSIISSPNIAGKPKNESSLLFGVNGLSNVHCT